MLLEALVQQHGQLSDADGAAALAAIAAQVTDHLTAASLSVSAVPVKHPANTHEIFRKKWHALGVVAWLEN